jgi:hypothetical protein
VFLHCSWQLCVVVEVVPVGCLYPSFYIQGGRGYNEGNRVGYNMISIRTLSPLAYFIYISIDIIIYVLRSTSWSSGIFWMVGRVIVDLSLGRLSPCVVVPWVLICVSRCAGCTWKLSNFRWCAGPLMKVRASSVGWIWPTEVKQLLLASMQTHRS